jgi:N-acyl-phosphatidylethanolamine-hydrolysing phospholipase D
MKKLLLILMFFNPLYSQDSLKAGKSHHIYNGFQNPFPGYEETDFKDIMKWMFWDRLIKNSKAEDSDTVVFEQAENDPEWLSKNRSVFSITWIGHSSMLIQLDGLNILSDPVFSDRASPVGFAGPKRLAPPGLDFDDLPDIDIVVISHNHYDHLDKETIEKLGNKPLYLVPLGLAGFFDDLNIDNYQELDWWDEFKFNHIRFVCVPAQHFSGRTLFDEGRTLWSGWVIQGKGDNIYYAGDSGYFPGFKEIADRLGPFEVTFLPIGAYEPRWFMKSVHMNPVEAVQAYQDLKGKYFFPVHWGTFVLSDEPLKEPPEMLIDEVHKRDLDESLFKILKHGETFIFPVKDIVSEKQEVTY